MIIEILMIHFSEISLGTTSRESLEQLNEPSRGVQQDSSMQDLKEAPSSVNGEDAIKEAV
jgi:hypothetical protein